MARAWQPCGPRSRGLSVRGRHTARSLGTVRPAGTVTYVDLRDRAVQGLCVSAGLPVLSVTASAVSESAVTVNLSMFPVVSVFALGT